MFWRHSSLRVLFSAYFITLSSKENTTAGFGGEKVETEFYDEKSSYNRIWSYRQKVMVPKLRITKEWKPERNQVSSVTTIGIRTNKVFKRISVTFLVLFSCVVVVVVFVVVLCCGVLVSAETNEEKLWKSIKTWT